MKIVENLGVLFLGIWLIARSIFTLFPLEFPRSATYFAVAAVLAGVFLFFRMRDSKPYISVAILLLCLYLILTGLSFLVNVQIPSATILLGGLAVLAGLFFLPTITDYRSFYSLGLFFLGVWLIGSNLIPYMGWNVPAFDIIQALVGILSALLLLLGM
jgi:hypothetical protein